MLDTCISFLYSREDYRQNRGPSVNRTIGIIGAGAVAIGGTFLGVNACLGSATTVLGPWVVCPAAAVAIGGAWVNFLNQLGVFDKSSLHHSTSTTRVSAFLPPWGVPGSRSDPSFKPRGYPGFCINIWEHNTNAYGGAADGFTAGGGNGGGTGADPGSGCESGCCSPPPPPPGAPCSGSGRGYGDLSSVGLPNSGEGMPRTLEPRNSMSALRGAIVTPNNGGIQGIVGIVDGAGAFAIPGLHPGDSITFTLYDPHSGLVDPDAGFGISPDIAEQGLWFPVFLYFNPDTSVYHIPIAAGDHLEDTISASRPIIEYLLFIPPGDIGKPLNFGFWSTENLRLWIQNPAGQFVYRDSSCSYKFLKNHVPTASGTYKITVSYGVAGGDGAFEFGVSSPPNFPISKLKGAISGVLSDNIAAYVTAGDISVASTDSLTVAPNVSVAVGSGHALVNAGFISCPSFDAFSFTSCVFTNGNRLHIEDSRLPVRNGLTFSVAQNSLITCSADTLQSVVVYSGGIITHPRGTTNGARVVADTIEIQSGGKIDVNAKGYRGSGRDGWSQLYGETAPGQNASTGYCGGSHGGSAGTQKTTGAPGSVYGMVDNPTTLGAGGADATTTYWGGGNGGGLIHLTADVIVFSGGELRANGAAGQGYSYGGGGAGGSINITAGHISGNAIISAYGGNGGTYGSSSESTGGGGGRIAIHYEEGTISGLTLGTTAGSGYYSNGGAGTIYLQGPDDGEDGILLVKNGGVAGATTPLPVGHGQFKRVDVLWGGRLTVGPLTDSLLALDSIIVSNTNSYITCADYTTCVSPLLRVKDSGYVRVDTNVTLQLPVIRLNNGGDFRTATDIAFASASDFTINSTASYLFVGKNTTFTIPQFNTTNIIAGYIYNLGDLRVESDSIIVGANVNLAEDGRIGPNDSIGYLQVFGKLDERARVYAVSNDDFLDTGLVFTAGKLIIESGGSIDVSSRGYRGNGRDSWSSSRSETYTGYLGASVYAGGSHGGLGGTDGAGYSGDPGNTFDSQTDPRKFGAGGGGDSPNNPGGNGGGAVVLNVGNLTMNGGLIRSQGQAGTSYGGGGAGGSINIRAVNVSGTGTISANGGAGGTYGSSGPSGGGGGGRIAFYWTTGSISGLTFTVTGGAGQNGTDGAAGTVYTQQITKNPGEAR